MLTVPPLRCGSVSEPSSRTNLPCSRPNPLHPPPWFTTAAGAAASYLLRHRRDKTISKRLPSQLPAQILLSAMKNSPSRGPDTHQQRVFWGIREHNPCNAGTSPSITEGDKETKKSHYFSRLHLKGIFYIISLHSSAFICRDTVKTFSSNPQHFQRLN